MKPVVVFTPACGGLSLVACKQRRHRLYWLGGCEFCEDSGGVLPFVLVVLHLHPQEGVCPPRTAVVVVSLPYCGDSLPLENGAGPVRTAVVLTLPLLAYACCHWAFLRMCRQRGQWWVSHCLVLCSHYAADVVGGR